MKIYRKLVLDLQTGNVLEEDSYEYGGPVVECKGEAQRAITQQGNYAQEQMSAASGSMQAFYNDLSGMMRDRFGDQSSTFNYLQNRMDRTLRSGPGTFQYRGPRGSGGVPPPGPRPGPGGGGGAGGGGLRGETTAAGPGGLLAYGYDPSLFDPNFTPEGFLGTEEAALRAEASEQNAAAFGAGAQALGRRSLQLGGYAPGIEQAGLLDLYQRQAEEEAAGQRDVSLYGAEQLRDDRRTFAPLEAQLQLGQAGAFAAASQARLQDLAQRRAIGAARGAANAAANQRAREFAARMRQENLQFQNQMRLAGANLRSENFFRGVGAMSGIAGMQDPMGYGQLAGNNLGQWGNMWQQPYLASMQYQQQQANKPSVWGKIGSAALAGALAIGTGGAGLALAPSIMSAGGWFGGGGSSAPAYQPQGGSSWNWGNFGFGGGTPTASTPWNPNLMTPGY